MEFTMAVIYKVHLHIYSYCTPKKIEDRFKCLPIRDMEAMQIIV